MRGRRIDAPCLDHDQTCPQTTCVRRIFVSSRFTMHGICRRGDAVADLILQDCVDSSTLERALAIPLVSTLGLSGHEVLHF